MLAMSDVAQTSGNCMQQPVYLLVTGKFYQYMHLSLCYNCLKFLFLFRNIKVLYKVIVFEFIVVFFDCVYLFSHIKSAVYVL